MSLPWRQIETTHWVCSENLKEITIWYYEKRKKKPTEKAERSVVARGWSRGLREDEQVELR